MVYLDGLKYACEACIKGHRSTSCSHTDRALFEIKKKGRPVTQCDHCRKLRKTKQVHVKCSCEGAEEEKSEHGKAKRKMPTSAAFPEGLKGLVGGTSTNLSPTRPPKRKVDSPSSACNCTSSGQCSCWTQASKKTIRPGDHAPSSAGPITPPVSCCGGIKRLTKLQPAGVLDNRHLGEPGHMAQPGTFNDTTASASSYQFGPLTATEGQTVYTYPISAGFSWPPVTGVNMCSCGVTCACPGCVEHADPSMALASSESCPYACATCSECNGFGFVAPSLAIGGDGGVDTDGFPMFDPRPILGPIPTSPTFGPTSARPFVSASECCGGGCKCAAQCQCTAECCGCCFGCVCSDSEGDREGCEDARERLGFAVSGERASCCSRERDKAGAGRVNKDRDRVGRGSNANLGWGEVADEDEVENGDARRKRRKLGLSEGETVGDLYLTTTETLTSLCKRDAVGLDAKPRIEH